MALQAKAIKQKIKGVTNIGKITRTMEMVSVAKMKKATAAAFLVKPYSEKSIDILSHISEKTISDNIYFKTDLKKEKILFIIVSSNKGLAGSFNTNIYKKILNELKEESFINKHIDLVCVGKQSEKIAKRIQRKIIASFIEITDTPTYDEASQIFGLVLNKYNLEDYKEVHLFYTKFIKSMTYEISRTKLLPISKTTKDVIISEHNNKYKKETLFEPNAEEIINTIVPRLITGFLYSALCDSSASEHSSRMFAMKTASDNAKEIKKNLTISYNRARQDAVTQELAEIAAAIQ